LRLLSWVFRDWVRFAFFFLTSAIKTCPEPAEGLGSFFQIGLAIAGTATGNTLKLA
jgi:hypothetical protein